jgi:Tol biopolymer transport system component
MGGILDFSWSPSSEFIMLDGGDVSNKEIYIVNVGKGSIVPLTDNAIHDSSPVWSPDGYYALFQSDREIVTVNIQSLEITEISSGTWPSWGARWSPDGELISFVEDESGSQTLSISNRATGTYESYPGFQGELTHLYGLLTASI